MSEAGVTVQSTKDGTVIACLGAPATANAMSDALAKGIRERRPPRGGP